MKRYQKSTLLFLALVSAGALYAQAPANPERPPGPPDAPPQFQPGLGPGGRGPGGPGGMGGRQTITKLIPQFDKSGDGRLDVSERKAARDFLAKEQAEGRRRRGPGERRGPPGGASPVVQPGPKVAAAEVKNYPTESFYDLTTLRTLFFEFENADWEKELADFNNTDVEVPAKLIVDGKAYPDVGVHFRGMSSYFSVGEGQKRSMNVSLDYVHSEQNVGGYRTLNLLNAHEDPSFIRPVLYSVVARNYIPIPKANLVRVVINGESWGVFVNQQQFNKEFTKEWFNSTKGARWKVPGSPGGRGSLEYLGDDPAPYKRIYDLKTKDSAKSWAALVKLCRVLNETPADKLESALAPLLDIDGALKFLALENALINNDGYWLRTSDYSLYEDEKGKFHVVPSDINEAFTRPGGPGFGGGGRGGRGGPGGPGGPGSPGGPGGGGGDDRVESARPESPGSASAEPAPNRPGPGESNRSGPVGGSGERVNGVELNPLYASKDANKPLLNKLLAVPSLRTRYLGYVRDIGDKGLDWARLGPITEGLHNLIAAEVEKDTRKLVSLEAFKSSIHGGESRNAEGGGRGPGTAMALKTFADQRRAYLLKLPVEK